MSRLPGQYDTTLDGQLGVVAPSGDGVRVIVGCSSLGTQDTPLGLSDPGQVAGGLGVGPLARDTADQLSQGGGIVWAVRCDGDVPGVITAEVGNPVTALTVTGAPLDAFDLVITITKTGAPSGVAQFTYSLDGGDTTSPAISSAATYVIPNSGLTINFSAVLYTISETFKFKTTAPKGSVSSIQRAIRAAMNTSALLFEYVQVAQPTDSAMWAALAALRVEAANARRYIDFLCETIAPGADPDAWVTTLLADKAGFSSVGVHIVALYGECVDTLTGRLEVQSAASRVGARISANKVHISPGWGALGALQGFQVAAPFTLKPQSVGAPRKVSSFNNAHALALQDAGFITGYTQVGAPGYWLARPNSAALDTSDFKFLMRSRIMNKARHLVHVSSFPFVQQDLDPTDLVASFAARANAATAALKSMIRAGELVKARVTLVPGQDLLASSIIRYKIRLVPKGYAMEIEDEFAFENPNLA
jgi:Protein of unknown function (DUF2586)